MTDKDNNSNNVDIQNAIHEKLHELNISQKTEDE